VRLKTSALLLLMLAGAVPALAADRTLPDRSFQLSTVVIASGGLGGVYQEYGQGIARALRTAFPGCEVEVRPTAASVQNLRLVAGGEADVGFTLADAAALASRGEEPFSAPLPVAALARLYDNYTHLVVRAQAPVHELADLRGQPVSTGAPGSGTELIAARLFAEAGLRADADVRRYRLDLAESVRALEEGRITAFFFSGGLPTQAIADLAHRTPIRLVNLAGFVAGLRVRHGEFYTELSIPAPVYGLDGDIVTVGVPNYLVVPVTMPDQEAYALTRLLFAAKTILVAAHPEARRLNRRAAIATYPVPLHPGAMRYYRGSKP
jgi:TRAP transporter TAXI family solute receptor